MFAPFRLNKTVGEAYDMDLEDSLNTKKALQTLGHLRAPDDGFSPYPDQAMLDGLKAFQHDQGLKVDGVMKPDGPTVEKINAALTENRPSDGKSGPGPEGVQLATAERRRPGQPAIGLEGGGLLRDPFAAGLLGLSTAAAAKIVLDQQSGRTEADGPSSSAPTPRISPPPKVPPLPGYPAPRGNERMPTKTEHLPAPVEINDLSQPVPDAQGPQILIYPALPEELRQQGHIIERKGNGATRKELEGIRDYYESLGWEHIAGGRYSKKHRLVTSGDQKAGGEQKEYYIPGPGVGRQGANYTDLTFKTKEGKIVHIQSVDVDRNGKPTQRELDAAERIRRATGDSIYLIPKGAQLPRRSR